MGNVVEAAMIKLGQPKRGLGMCERMKRDEMRSRTMKLDLRIQQKVRLVRLLTLSPRLQGSTTAITIRTQAVMKVRILNGSA